MRDEFAAKFREGAAKIGYLITTSGSTYSLLTQAHARAAAREGIQLIEVGVGDNIDEDNLRALQVNCYFTYRLHSPR